MGARGYTGTLAGVVFEDGRPTSGKPSDPGRSLTAIIGYARRHGLRVEGDRLVIPETDAAESPDPREVGEDGSGIVTVGTKLRDAAVDPAPADFLPPTNAGQANPHGPEVVSPGVHGTPPGPIVPGDVPKDPEAQEAKETSAAAEALAAPVKEPRKGAK